MGKNFCLLDSVPDRPWGTSSFWATRGDESSFSGNRGTGVLSLPVTFFYGRDGDSVELNCHSPIYHHGVVFNEERHLLHCTLHTTVSELYQKKKHDDFIFTRRRPKTASRAYSRHSKLIRTTLQQHCRRCPPATDRNTHDR